MSSADDPGGSRPFTRWSRRFKFYSAHHPSITYRHSTISLGPSCAVGEGNVLARRGLEPKEWHSRGHGSIPVSSTTSKSFQRHPHSPTWRCAATPRTSGPTARAPPPAAPVGQIQGAGGRNRPTAGPTRARASRVSSAAGSPLRTGGRESEAEGHLGKARPADGYFERGVANARAAAKCRRSREERAMKSE